MLHALSLIAAPAVLLLATLPGASAHALVSDIRVPGPAHLAKCGQKSFDEVTKDPSGHIEDQEPVNQGCELQLCRGLLFKDQAATAASTVQTVPGGNVTFNVKCTIPHGGPATVSLIDTTTGGTGTVIGNFLKEFDSFCPNGETPPDQSTLQVTLPDAATINGRCSKPGDCVTQLFWATSDLSQNYYYCKDTVISGGNTTEGSSSVPAAASTDNVAPAESSVEDPALIAQPTDIQDADPAAETGVADAGVPAGTDPAVDTGAEDTAIVDQPTAVDDADTAVETGVEDTAIVDQPTAVEDADTAVETGAEDTAIVDQPTAVEDADTAVETGAEDTAIVEQPTAVEGDDTAVETGVDGAATPTGTAEAAAPTESAIGKGKLGAKELLDLIKKFLANKKKSKQAPQATTPVEPPATAKRWVKEHY